MRESAQSFPIPCKHQFLAITEREQRRLGQELHDGLCQELTGLSFLSHRIETILHEQQHPEAAKQAELTQALREVIKQARNLARGFYPTELETDGLEAALAVLARHIETVYDIGVSLITTPIRVSPHPEIQLHLYRIVQEAMMNAVKHANATSLFIRLTSTTTGLSLSVADDGQGWAQTPQLSSGMGLHIMHNRAQLIGATLSIRSRAEGGIEVVCNFQMPSEPIPNDPRNLHDIRSLK